MLLALVCAVVTSLPATLSSPGCYCLSSDLAFAPASGVAITITASEVTLDLAGHVLSGTAGTSTLAVGISAPSASRVTVRNGTVRGFQAGVLLSGGPGLLVEDLRAQLNYYQGIAAIGAGSIVRRNQVAQTGGTTLGGPYTIPIAVKISGSGSRAEDNVITSTTPPPGGESIGVHLAGTSPGITARGNTISNSNVSADSWAVWVDSPDALVMGNTIARYGNGVAFPTGASGVYRGNTFLTVTFPLPVGGGTYADGGENIAFP